MFFPEITSPWTKPQFVVGGVGVFVGVRLGRRIFDNLK